MNILIVGKNKINNTLEQCIQSEGYTPIVIENAMSIQSFEGQAGDFVAKTTDGTFHAQFVVVTEEPASNPSGNKYLPFSDDTVKSLFSVDFAKPILFLLDFEVDSSESDTIFALQSAIVLAKKKRKVVFLSKFVRTAGENIESLYKEARIDGVTFVKYEDLKISFDSENNTFDVFASDGVIDLSFKTPYVLKPSTEPSSIYPTLTKKLRIKTYKNNVGNSIVNEDRYFLNPVLTGRKGVYYINPNGVFGTESISYILSSIKEEPHKLAVENFAVVDSYKCAFCYTCFRACPHAAMEPDVKAAAMVNRNTACDGCGICVSVCPADAIKLNGEQVAEKPVKKAGKMKIFCCENSAELALKQILPELGTCASKIDFESVPCGGRISLEVLAGALRSYDKIVVAVCVDQACKHFDGNKRACLQANKLTEQLKKAGVDSDRVEYLQVSHAMTGVLKDKLAAIMGC